MKPAHPHVRKGLVALACALAIAAFGGCASSAKSEEDAVFYRGVAYALAESELNDQVEALIKSEGTDIGEVCGTKEQLSSLETDDDNLYASKLPVGTKITEYPLDTSTSVLCTTVDGEVRYYVAFEVKDSAGNISQVSPLALVTDE